MNIPAIDLVAVGTAVSLLTQVLKKAPKIPVDSGNAMVVAFVLAVILAFVPVLLGGSLASANAELIAQNVASIFGAATILYKAVKIIRDKLMARFGK